MAKKARTYFGPRPEVDPIERMSKRPKIEQESDTAYITIWERRSPIGGTYVKKLGMMSIMWSFGVIIGINMSLELLGAFLLGIVLTTSMEAASYFIHSYQISNSDYAPISNSFSRTENFAKIGDEFVAGLIIKEVPLSLFGRMETLLESLVNSDINFQYSLSLCPVDFDDVLKSSNLTEFVSENWSEMSSGLQQATIGKMAGFWNVSITMIISAPDEIKLEASLHVIRNSVRASIPGAKLREMNLQNLYSSSLLSQPPTFVATGAEITRAIFDIKPVLLGKVQFRVPGEFILPTGLQYDIKIGRIIDTETQNEVEDAGFKRDMVPKGIAIVGGIHDERMKTTFRVLKGLSERGINFIFITGDSNYRKLLRLIDNLVILRLGRDFILNPVDPEGLPSNLYGSLLRSILTTAAYKAGVPTPEFDMALMDVLSDGSSTIEDLLDKYESVSTGMDRASEELYRFVMSLKIGEGAESFYGVQNCSISDLISHGPVIIEYNLQSPTLRFMASSLIATKLLAYNGDISALGFSSAALMFSMPARGLISEYEDNIWKGLQKGLSKKKIGILLSTDSPTDLPYSMYNNLAISISHRVTSSSDVSTVADRMGLSALSHGLYSKNRYGSRETTYLRTLDYGEALYIVEGVSTGFPIKINYKFESKLEDVSESEIKARLGDLRPELSMRIFRPASTTLEKDFGGKALLAAMILKLLTNYEVLSQEGIVSALSKKAERDEIVRIVKGLAEHGYLTQVSEGYGGFKVASYTITERGRMNLEMFEDGHGEVELK